MGEVLGFLVDWRPSLSRWVGVAATCAISTSVGVAASPAASAASLKPPRQSATISSSAPDLVTAQVAARANGSRVEVEASRTETSTTWANPDGSLTTDQHFGPIRFRDKQDRWTPVDLSLTAEANGTAAPESHPRNLRLAGTKGSDRQTKSSAGTSFASIEEPKIPGRGKFKGRFVPAPKALGVNFDWGDTLPAPTIVGEKATYAEVEPGVDMVVEARRSGFEQKLIIKDKQALHALVKKAGTKGPTWTLPVSMTGLSARQEKDGSVSFLNDAGDLVSYLAPALAWDDSPEAAEGTGVTSPVGMSVKKLGKGQAQVTVTPDVEWLTDPDRQFPITVDPTYASATTTATFDTWVRSGVTTNQSTTTVLRVGSTDAGATSARSYLNFPNSLKGLDIKSAKLKLYSTWAPSCTARRLNVTHAAEASTATTWSNQPWVSSINGGYKSFAVGGSGCPAGWVEVDVTQLGRQWSTSSLTTAGMRLTAATESDPSFAKNFASSETSNDPYVSYTYNRKPNQAAAPAVDGLSYKAPGASSATVYTRDSTPQLSTTATDPDLDRYKAHFEVWSSTTGGSKVAECDSSTSPYTASGASATCSPSTALPDNSTFYVKASVTDDQGLLNSTWSPWTTFKTSYATTTSSPTVSCPTPYTNGSWATNTPASPLVCTVTAVGTGNSAPGSVIVSVDKKASTVPLTQSSDPAVAKTTVTVSNTEGGHEITARAVSPAGVTSPEVSYRFGYSGAALSLPVDKTTTSGAVKVAASAPPGATSAKLQWRLAGGASWNDGPTLATSSVSGGPVSATGTWDTQDVAGGGVPLRTAATLEYQVCFTYPDASKKCTVSATPYTLTRVPHAFGDYPVVDAPGVGQVAQYTGELSSSATDADIGGLSVGRSHASFTGDGSVTGWTTNANSDVFGPGWTTSIGSDRGMAALRVVDNTTVDGTIVLTADSIGELVFQHPSKTAGSYAAGTYVPKTQNTVDSMSTLVLSGVGTSARLTLKTFDGSETQWSPSAAPSTSSVTMWTSTSEVNPGTTAQTRYGRDSQGRTTRIVSIPEGMAPTQCPLTGSMVRGCRALDITYGASNTGTTTMPGDRVGQVKAVTATLWDPATAAMKTTAVASYGYDNLGRLVTVKDDRTNLTTSYGWDGSSTRLSMLAPPGQAPFRIWYTTANSGARVKQITRDSATAATWTRSALATAPSGSSVLASFIYDIDPSTTISGLPALTAETVGDWFQQTAPQRAFATFGPDRPLAGTQVGEISAADWPYADLVYTDEEGRTVNTASYGAGKWLLTAADFDDEGREVRTLNRPAIAAATNKNLSRGEVDASSTQTIYNAEGNVTDTYEPIRMAASGWNPRQLVRTHTKTIYDQGAPAGGPYNLPTTETVNASDANGEDLATLTITRTSYDPVVAGDQSGWATGAATAVTQVDTWDAAPAKDVTRTTRYDSQGRPIENRAPLSNGSDAATTKTVYYSSGTNASDSNCGNKPEWSGLICRVYPAGSPSSGPALPDQRLEYSRTLQTVKTTETSGGSARTANFTFDSADRVVTAKLTSSITGSSSRPGTYISYDAATGEVNYTGDVNSAGTDADATNRVTTVRDGWGRPISYKNDLGETTTTSYTPSGDVATVVDPKGTTSYTWDGSDASGQVERRGLATKVVASRGGTNGGVLTFSGSYDEAGNLTTEKLPGKIIRRSTFNATGDQVELSYSGQVTPVTELVDEDGGTTWVPGTPVQDQTWLSWSRYYDALGRVTNEFNGAGSGFDGVPGVTDPADLQAPSSGRALAADKVYTYDAVGRLEYTTDRTAPTTGELATPDVWYGAALPCSKRRYEFNKSGARTKLIENTIVSGDCFASGVERVTTYGYDEADRPVSSGVLDGVAGGAYNYDAFGRTTVIPAQDAPVPALGDVKLRYFDDDQIREIEQNGKITTFTLDSQGRRQRYVDADSDQTQHYGNSSDSPSWTSEVVSGTVRTTRFVSGLGGVTATIDASGNAFLPISNPRGDNVSSIAVASSETTPATTLAAGWSTYDEYGQVQTGQSVDTLGQGFLGQMQRGAGSWSAQLGLMGKRVYNSKRALFTTADPVAGGNETSFGYPNDPVNSEDASGERRKYFGRGSYIDYGYSGQTKGPYRTQVGMFTGWKWTYRSAFWFNAHVSWHDLKEGGLLVGSTSKTLNYAMKTYKFGKKLLPWVNVVDTLFSAAMVWCFIWRKGYTGYASVVMDVSVFGYWWGRWRQSIFVWTVPKIGSNCWS